MLVKKGIGRFWERIVPLLLLVSKVYLLKDPITKDFPKGQCSVSDYQVLDHFLSGFKEGLTVI